MPKSKLFISNSPSVYYTVNKLNRVSKSLEILCYPINIHSWILNRTNAAIILYVRIYYFYKKTRYFFQTMKNDVTFLRSRTKRLTYFTIFIPFFSSYPLLSPTSRFDD